MAVETVVDQIVKSLSFDVKAVPQTDPSLVPSASNSTPLNLKIRVRKKDEGGMQQGVLSVPKFGHPEGNPERIRLISSDQTIMSFNVAMEADFENKPKRKSRKSFFGGCLGTQYDDDEIPYIPSSGLDAKITDPNVASKSEGVIGKNLTLSKNKYDNTDALQPYSKKHGILGKCKPGGCLDPPFSEAKYSYEPIQKPKLNMPSITEDTVKTNAKVKISNTDDRHKTATDLLENDSKQRSKVNADENSISILSIYDNSLEGSLNSKYSDSVITYPPLMSPSVVSNDKISKNRVYSEERPNKRSFDESIEAFFSSPKKNNRFNEKNNNGADDLKKETTKSAIPAHIPLHLPVEADKIVSKTNDFQAVQPNIQPLGPPMKLEEEKDRTLVDIVNESKGIYNNSNTNVSLEQDSYHKNLITSSKTSVRNDEDVNHLKQEGSIKPSLLSMSKVLESKLPVHSDKYLNNEIIEDTKDKTNSSLYSGLSTLLHIKNGDLSSQDSDHMTTRKSTTHEQSKNAESLGTNHVENEYSVSEPNLLKENNQPANVVQNKSTDSKVLQIGQNVMKINEFVADTPDTKTETESASFVQMPIDKTNDQINNSYGEHNKPSGNVVVETTAENFMPYEETKDNQSNIASMNNLMINGSPNHINEKDLHKVPVTKSSITSLDVSDKQDIEKSTPEFDEKKSLILQEKLINTNENLVEKSLEGIIFDNEDTIPNYDGDKKPIKNDILYQHTLENDNSKISTNDNIETKFSSHLITKQNTTNESEPASIKEQDYIKQESSYVENNHHMDNINEIGKVKSQEKSNYILSPPIDISNGPHSPRNKFGAETKLSELHSKDFPAHFDKDSSKRVLKPVLEIKDSKHKTKKQNKETQESSKSSLKKDSIDLDLGFQSIVNDKKELTIKTIDTSLDPARYPEDSVTIIQSHLRPNLNEIRIPIDLNNTMTIKIHRTKSPTQRVQIIKQDPDDTILPTLTKNIGISKLVKDKYEDFSHDWDKELSGKEIPTILNSVYEQELVPLQKTIKHLKKEIDLFASQQSALIAKLFRDRRTKSIRLLRINSRCVCSKNR